MKTKTKVATSVSGTVAALAIIFGLLFGNGTSSVDLSGTYEINEVDDNKNIIIFQLPEKYTPGYCELYINDILVTETVVNTSNKGTFTVVPLMTEGMGNLSIKFYDKKEPSGVGMFSDNGILSLKVLEEYIDDK